MVVDWALNVKVFFLAENGFILLWNLCECIVIAVCNVNCDKVG